MLYSSVTKKRLPCSLLSTEKLWKKPFRAKKRQMFLLPGNCYLGVRAGNRKEFSRYYYVRDPGPATCDPRSATCDLWIRPAARKARVNGEQVRENRWQRYFPSNEHPGSVKIVGVICSVIYSIIQAFLMLISVIWNCWTSGNENSTKNACENYVGQNDCIRFSVDGGKRWKLNLHKNLFLPKFLNRLLMYKINLQIFILSGFFARIRHCAKGF